MFWGLRARYYDSATTAALFYQAEVFTPLNGASSVSHTGSSSNLAVSLVWPGLAGQWVSMLATRLPGLNVDLTHKGSYRVWIRASSDVAPPPSFRLQWGPAGLATPITNDAATVPAGNNSYYLLDLGVIRIDAPPVGNNVWQGVIQATSNDTSVNGNTYRIDCVWLQPLDEAAGQAIYTPAAPASSVVVTDFPGSGGNDSTVGTVGWAAGGGTGAASSILHGATTQYLTQTNFGFGIPAGSTIIGIQANITRRQGAGFINSVLDNSVRLIKAGVVQSVGEHASGVPYPQSDTLLSYGGPTDLWGGTWTPSDIDASGFGVAISATNTSATITAGAFVDAVTISVYYTLASGFTVAADAVIYALQSAELRTEGLFRQASGGTVYAPASQVYGDLPRLPPSGLEGGTVEALIKLSRGDFGQLPDARHRRRLGEDHLPPELPVHAVTGPPLQLSVDIAAPDGSTHNRLGLRRARPRQRAERPHVLVDDARRVRAGDADAAAQARRRLPRPRGVQQGHDPRRRRAGRMARTIGDRAAHLRAAARDLTGLDRLSGGARRTTTRRGRSTSTVT